MTTLAVVLAPILLAFLAGAPQEVCVADAGAPGLDHVVIVVADLDAAAGGVARHGFRLKAGRLHANGLVNRHVKFRDGTGLELMTVAGEPGDRMAEDYAELLDAGEGGVYVALTAPELAPALEAADDLGLATIRSGSGPWRFVSFPPTSPAAAVFFGAGRPPAHDPDSVLAHAPPVDGLAEVWTEGGPALGRLLSRLGARRCGTARGPAGVEGTRWALGRGSLVVVPGPPERRPRVLGAVLRRAGAAEGADATVGEVADVIRIHPRFWVAYWGMAGARDGAP